MTTAHVAIDLYSGRENPAWDLTPADAAELLTRLKTLSIAPDDPVTPSDALGYRGLQVDVREAATTQRYTLSEQRVVPSTGPALHDAHRTLERWLLATGQPVLGTKLLTFLLAPRE